ncbi:hypothetical protein TNCV_2485351 [Trichonephila clavipes]|uniref:Uncharacterized protein n=1 Tax=Trichonephila clavipes TaxID=2585209 RepID=A0A8X6VZI6_TRICX|nr:hypothetical protein TNCV_2485351 [Trichonephila clavipes]
MAPWPRAPVIPQLVDCKNFRDNRWDGTLTVLKYRDEMVELCEVPFWEGLSSQSIFTHDKSISSTQGSAGRRIPRCKGCSKNGVTNQILITESYRACLEGSW